MNKKSPQDKFDQLRVQAEDLLKQNHDTNKEIPTDLFDLIHELKIHQAELEIQNEELQRAQLEITELQREFEKLYEIAPSAYITLNSRGLISRANTAATNYLGKSIEQLRNLALINFIDPDFENQFLNARTQSVETERIQSIDIKLKGSDDILGWVHMDIEAEIDDNKVATQWNVIFVDITDLVLAHEELEKKAKELKYWNSHFVNREMKMIELKEEVNVLLSAKGEKPKY